MTVVLLATGTGGGDTDGILANATVTCGAEKLSTRYPGQCKRPAARQVRRFEVA